MSIVKGRNTIVVKKVVHTNEPCYHCGTACITETIHIDEKVFCCEGCKLVYEIINSNGLCDYYTLQSHPGISQVKPVRNGKFAYLDDSTTVRQLLRFSDGQHAIVTLYIPGVHCTSCMWLLEHMHKLDAGITESRLNFSTKEVTIHFLQDKIGLRKVVELLTTIGYEPYISLDDTSKKKAGKVDRSRIYKLGIAGFCFGNIMMMSFPEYLSDTGMEYQYATLFRVLNLVLSVPVFFYAASEFFTTAWAGIKQKTLNIDAPIALAILITYTRSIYEIFTNTGSGYLDSMSGIVFFMLVGRVVQERAYRSVSFHRDYKAYFPIAVNVVTADGQESRKLPDLKEGDVVLLYNEEIIPADAVVLEGNANIDYSFVTGESAPVTIAAGETVYAGGKQMGGDLTIRVLKPVAGSYLTSLWNHYAFGKNKIEQNKNGSVIHTLSRYFTIVLLSLAALTALYWAFTDPAKILPSVSAMLIVACPCALLLSATYTNGNLLRIFSNNGLYLRDASVIEQLGAIDHIVFDKTGTLTEGNGVFSAGAHQMNATQLAIIYTTVCSSKHPYSKALAAYVGVQDKLPVTSWEEIPGQGIRAVVAGNDVWVGSAGFVGTTGQDNTAAVYVKINSSVIAFNQDPEFRPCISKVISSLKKGYSLSLLSGDNDRHKHHLETLFGDSTLLFRQQPVNKLEYIESLQNTGVKVAMIGDGLNDAGALQQSNVGVTLAGDINNFTPSCDVILDAQKFSSLPQLLRLSQASKSIIGISFILSVLYNLVGLAIAVQGMMNPMIAAILMPVSTVSIVLFTTVASSVWAKRLGLSLHSKAETN